MFDLAEATLEAAQWQARGPCDLSGHGYSPITVGNAAGRAEYVRCQNAIAQRAAPLRAGLLERCDRLAAFAGCR